MFRSTVIKGTEALSWASWPAVGLPDACPGTLPVGNRCRIAIKLASFRPSSACRGKLLSCILWWQVVEKGPHWKQAFYEMDRRMTSPRQEMTHRAKISAHTTCISHIKCKTGPIEPFKNRYTMHPESRSPFLRKCFENVNVWKRWASNQIVLHQTKTKGRSQKFAPRNILKYFGWYSCSCHAAFWC